VLAFSSMCSGCMYSIQLQCRIVGGVLWVSTSTFSCFVVDLRIFGRPKETDLLHTAFTEEIQLYEITEGKEVRVRVPPWHATPSTISTSKYGAKVPVLAT
jgi:hypothetical protein